MEERVGERVRGREIGASDGAIGKGGYGMGGKVEGRGKRACDLKHKEGV